MQPHPAPALPRTDAPTAVVWDEALTGYDLGGDHPMHPVRLRLTMRLAEAMGVLDGHPIMRPEPAADADLLAVHTPDYLRAVSEAPGRSGDAEHGLGTADVPTFARMHEASSLVAGASLRAARAVWQGEASRAVSLSGGLHHAMPDRAAGFCVYNDPAVAIRWLLANGARRVAYIDIDVHHGDGVQTVFWDDPRVLTVSVHQHPMTLWPGTGYVSELGGDGARGSAVNLPLMPGTDDEAWLRAFHAVVPALVRGFEPDVLVSQCGVDTHAEDPLADMGLTVDGQRAAFSMLAQLADSASAGRWLVLGGGGYALHRVVPRSWTHLLAIACGAPVDPQAQVPVSWRTEVEPTVRHLTLPPQMTDGGSQVLRPWGGASEQQVDSVIKQCRRAVYPLHGLDPDDPRD